MIALLLLACAPLDLGTREAAGVRGRLWIDVPREGAGPGLARARLEVEIDGPPDVEADGPRLEDALAAWRVPLAGASWAEGRLSRWVALEQIKPGAAALPGVVVRVRAGPGGQWAELAWPGPLHDLRGVASIEPSPPPPPGPWWPWLLAAGLLAIPLLTLFRRRPPPAKTPPPHERALAALAAARDFDAVEAALRRYLAERHGVPPARTPAEIARDHPAPAEVLRRCERARFGPAAIPEDLEEALSLARAALTKEGQSGQIAAASEVRPAG